MRAYAGLARSRSSRLTGMIRCTVAGRWRHHDDHIAERDRFRHVVRDEQHRRAVESQQRLELLLQLEPRERIDGGERLVEQQQPRLQRQRARDAHALRHAARQLARIRVLEVGEADGVQEARRRCLRIAPRMCPRVRSPIATFWRTVIHGKEPRLLERHAEVTGGSHLHRAAIPATCAARRAQQSCGEAEQRALAATRRPDDAGDAARQVCGTTHRSARRCGAACRGNRVKDVVDDELAAVRAHRRRSHVRASAASRGDGAARRASRIAVIDNRAANATASRSARSRRRRSHR